MISDLQPNEKVAFAVGAIVLRCHEIERLFKFIVPHIDGKAPAWSSRAQRIDKLARKPLGDVADRFVDATTGDTDALRTYVQTFVDKRNGVVHHFGDLYGQRWAAGQHDEVLADLRNLHKDATALLHMLREVLIVIAETTRDTIFVGTNDYEGFAAICSDLRAAIDAENAQG